MLPLGDFVAGATVYFKFTTVDKTTPGAPIVLTGSPAISVYKNGSTTQSTAGVTLTTSFDSVTGLNHVEIDLSADGTFYSAGADFDVVITTGTIDGVSAVGYVVAHFSIQNRYGAAAVLAAVSTVGGYVDTEIGSIISTLSSISSSLSTLSGYVDTEVAAIKAKTDNLPAAPAAVGDIPTANAVADALLDRADAVETGWTPRKALRIMFAALGGKLSGCESNAPVFRNAGADSKNRITATTDGSGNRSAVTLDGD